MNKIIEGKITMLGFDNWFVIQNMYGEDFSFLNAEIYNLKADGLCGTLELEVEAGETVKCPPKRWKKWDKTYITIEFFCVNNINMKIDDEHLVISDFSIDKIDDRYIMKISCGDNIIICQYMVARIQNITPLVWNEKTECYEAI